MAASALHDILADPNWREDESKRATVIHWCHGWTPAPCYGWEAVLLYERDILKRENTWGTGQI